LGIAVFDTYAFIKRLTAAGMPEAQAEVLADEQVRLIDDRLATKDDIAKLQGATSADISKHQAAMSAELSKYQAAMSSELSKYQASMSADLSKYQVASSADLSKHQATMSADLAKVEIAAKRDLREAELRLEGKIEATKSEILKWMFGQTLLILGAVLALTRIGH
jgi:hypothetical protein